MFMPSIRFEVVALSVIPGFFHLPSNILPEPFEQSFGSFGHRRPFFQSLLSRDILAGPDPLLRPIGWRSQPNRTIGWLPQVKQTSETDI
jgi:hypothetical protein